MHGPSSYSRVSGGDLDVKMTPMIDVVFLLLIFFVWTASFRVAEFDLPTTLSAPAGQGMEADSEVIDFERIAVRIHWRKQRPAWTINGRELAGLPQLHDTLAGVAAISSELPVVLDPEAAVPLGDVIDVYDIARQVGFARVHFTAME